MYKKGMTLIEMLVAIGIFSVIMLGIVLLFSTLWRMQGFSVSMGMSVQQATQSMTRIEHLVRNARQADNGAYPIVDATGNELIMYSQADDDDNTERVRIWRDGTFIKRGIVQPSGTIPVQYDVATESVEIIARDIIDNNDGADLFVYYDASNAAVTTDAISATRMIRMTITVDVDAAELPVGVIISTIASMRNLREW